MIKDVGMVFGGAAIFILGMNFLEGAMQALSGRGFKLFLKKYTSHVLSAIGMGTLASALLQSSSIVNLLILSLTSSSAITLKSALAVTLGSNLGTTLNTWILSVVGFSFDISLAAFPIIAFAGLARASFKDKAAFYNVLTSLLGIGFIMLGLDFIKTGMKDYVESVDLSYFRDFPAITYLLIGILLTSLLQSSAATLAIVLSALHSTAIDFNAATALVLGAEIGTTLKFLFVAYHSDSTVRRVAVGNFLYNVLNAVAIFLLLGVINQFIINTLSIQNPLTALALFQTLINMTAIVICAPLLNLSARWLTKAFADKPNATKYIRETPVPDTGLAIDALQQETRHFLEAVLQYYVHLLNLGDTAPKYDLSPRFLSLGAAGQYDFIKQLHGDIFKYYIKVQQAQTLPAETEDLDRLMCIVREAIFAAKNIHDAERDIAQLSNSANEAKYGFYLKSRALSASLLLHINELMNNAELKDKLYAISDIYRTLRKNQIDTFTCNNEKIAGLSEIELSTLINFNRELFNGLNAIVLGVKDLVLESKQRQQFEYLIDEEEERIRSRSSAT